MQLTLPFSKLIVSTVKPTLLKFPAVRTSRSARVSYDANGRDKQLRRRIRVLALLLGTLPGLTAGCATANAPKPGLASVTAGPASHDGPAGRWNGELICSDGDLHGELELKAAKGQVFDATLRLYRPNFPLLSRTLQFQAVVDPVSGNLVLASPSPALRSVRGVFASDYSELIGFAADARGAARFDFIHAGRLVLAATK